MRSEKLAVTIRARKLYVAEHVAAVLPGPRDEPLPKAVIWHKTAASAQKNGLAKQPFFKGDATKCETYAENNWGGQDGIRAVMSEDLGVLVEYGHGLKGIRRAGKKGAEATAEWLRGTIEASKDVHNVHVEHARLLGAKCPTMQLRLLLT